MVWDPRVLVPSNTKGDRIFVCGDSHTLSTGNITGVVVVVVVAFKEMGTDDNDDDDDDDDDKEEEEVRLQMRSITTTTSHIISVVGDHYITDNLYLLLFLVLLSAWAMMKIREETWTLQPALVTGLKHWHLRPGQHPFIPSIPSICSSCCCCCCYYHYFYL